MRFTHLRRQNEEIINLAWTCRKSGILRILIRINILSGILSYVAMKLSLGLVFTGLYFAVLLFLGCLSVFLYIKRLHDLNRSGWYYPGFIAALVVVFLIDDYITPFAKFVGFPLALFGFVAIYFIKGTSGENKYGPDPLGVTNKEDLNVSEMSQM